MIGRQISAHEYSFSIKHAGVKIGIPYPLLRDEYGEKQMWLVGPEHGRSYIVGMDPDGRFVISKGNGLSYTPYPFLNTGEMGKDSWGLLLEEDATRDFILGNEVANMGVKTNRMQYVLELNYPLMIQGEKVKPYLLQYSVECPYRISDSAYIPTQEIWSQVEKWPRRHRYHYLDAAEVLIGNLKTLHQNKILHNAITIHNYTWALELLDFELACSPMTPYGREDYQRHVPTLMPREVMHTYQIIIFIAAVLAEKPDDQELTAVFRSYGFDLGKHIIGNNNQK